MAVYEGEQEILVSSDFNYASTRWCFVSAGQELGYRALYLHSVLARLVTSIRW